MTEKVLRSAVLRAARKKLDFRPERELQENLEWAADNKADAYRIGAQEAQAEIIQRLQELKADA